MATAIAAFTIHGCHTANARDLPFLILSVLNLFVHSNKNINLITNIAITSSNIILNNSFFITLTFTFASLK
uniref:Uncharacterized protein n=1 Tax=Pararge aegeria TaxID=116150 RepID=S4PFT0_9NEOP